MIISALVHSGQFFVGAIRIFPENTVAEVEQNSNNKKNQTELFQKYFADLNNSTRNGNGTLLQDSKRRVPSCPDPLHNK